MSTSVAIARALHRALRLLVLPCGRRDNPLAGWLFDLTGGIYRTAGMRFEVPRELTTRAFRGRFFMDAWERPERQLVERFVDPRATVLEIGGGIGVVAGHVQRRLEEPERHVVVEAHPALVPLLERNRHRNGHRYAVEHGVVSTTSDGTFHVHPLIVGGSTVRRTGRAVQVPVVPYTDIERRHDLAFDTLVLDLEGGEVELLRQIADHLPHVHTVLVEMHERIVGPAAVDECRGLLHRAGLTRLAALGAVEAWGRA